MCVAREVFNESGDRFCEPHCLRHGEDHK